MRILTTIIFLASLAQAESLPLPVQVRIVGDTDTVLAVHSVWQAQGYLDFQIDKIGYVENKDFCHPQTYGGKIVLCLDSASWLAQGRIMPSIRGRSEGAGVDVNLGWSESYNGKLIAHELEHQRQWLVEHQSYHTITGIMSWPYFGWIIWPLSPLDFATGITR